MAMHDAQEPKQATQHGGLGRNEQSPFLFVAGGGFEPGDHLCRSSLNDIAPSVLRHPGPRRARSRWSAAAAAANPRPQSHRRAS
jgi:hypothetical protein